MHSGSNTNNILLIRKLYINQLELINIGGLVRSQYTKEKAAQNGRETTRKTYVAQTILYLSDDSV